MSTIPHAVNRRNLNMILEIHQSSMAVMYSQRWQRQEALAHITYPACDAHCPAPASTTFVHSYSNLCKRQLTMAAPEESSRFLRLTRDPGSSNITCYVCLQMRERKPSWKQDGPAEKCILCNNSYCDKHKSNGTPLTCEINHETYCSKASHKARHAPVRIFSKYTGAGGLYSFKW
jgi:hypothetical protein